MENIEQLKFTIEPEEKGIRIDKVIAERLGEDYSRMYVKYLMDNGCVLVNGKRVKPSYSVRENDVVTVELKPTEINDDVEPEDIPLDVIYEDDSVIVINKPAGLVVHPGAGNKKGTLVNALLHHCGKLPEGGDRMRPGIVHRLDKDTSGVMVIAKNERALRSLAKQFQKRAIKKIYIAVVEGRVELDNGVVNMPVGRHVMDRTKMDVRFEDGKEAVTEYSVVRRYKNFPLLRLKLGTGRTHQIRVHLKHIGHSILGDVQYGSGRAKSRQALHAERLGFTHPDTSKYVEFSAPLPNDMKKIIDDLDKNG
ncbi:MAG: RluA family pseudouridine synthase [Candidatus Omnitrophica bacterium]|nr:RluA family pseudouridine synthase [Candidatus Omnitrophota bacterium]